MTSNMGDQCIAYNSDLHENHLGSLLHFEDYNLRQIYFLDPQWLPKMMADVIQPTIRGKESEFSL